MNDRRTRLSRIYTRTGDGGTTRLVGGQEIGKDDLRIQSYGTVDELSSVLGVARAVNAERPEGASGRSEFEAHLRRIQNELFSVGSELATRAEDFWADMPRVGAREVAALEAFLDELNAELGSLREFLLPGGGPLGAQVHVARTVCRRAERDVVALHAREPWDGHVVEYLNRLSDFLFVLARWIARRTGHPEQLWTRSAPAESSDE